MTKKYLASRLFFTITNLLLITNSFFAKQFSIIEKNSVLPSSTIPVTDQYLANTEFTKDDIKRIICKLDSNKAHGHDMISIRMLKVSGDAIIEPLFKIFKNCLKCGIFPDDWKKGNIVPIFKKGDKQNIKNYRPVSLLPICSKIFERIIYDNMLKYFLDNNLITPKQSGFRPGDSCINQLLSITHDIFTSFDNGLEVRGVFLDISKAFDKVLRDGLIYKLIQNGIKDKLLCILIEFLKNRQQRIVLNGSHRGQRWMQALHRGQFWDLYPLLNFNGNPVQLQKHLGLF